MRCLIYDKDGANALEVKVKVDNAVWGSGEITEANIGIPITEPKLDSDLLREGNLVILEDENLIPWGGVIMPPISWSMDSVVIAVQSPEFYLDWRYTSQEFSSSQTTGSVIRKMVASTNKEFPLPYSIRGKNIDTDGVLGSETTLEKGSNIYRALQTIARENSIVWWFEVVQRKRSPLFEFHAENERTSDGAPIEIGANGNAAWGGMGIVESGQIVSSYLAKTKDSEYAVGKTSRFVVQSLLNNYGFFEKVIDVESIPVGGGRPREVKAEIRKNKLSRAFHILAYLGTLTKTMRPGSVHLLNASDLGFSGSGRGVSTSVQIDQMLYNENNGVLEIVAFEID